MKMLDLFNNDRKRVKNAQKDKKKNTYFQKHVFFSFFAFLHGLPDYFL